ncbi:hypothetical protein CBA19CS11_37305 [Caballeronia novacaledonica]|uniref:hypothetical protein n=1 Tax=Caballeronia novacaledonica TaxID=1544861 RepID=UPI001EE1D775|nr:hypothetical protein [Caballeronia novacaledonica]GJH14621.1 hypothetical protein CBA19CS11_37305 [Caballeronia novacaledonica]
MSSSSRARSWRTSASIDAAQGTAELAAGSQVLLQDASGSQQVFVQTGSGGTGLNTGAIRAAQINLQAADGNVYALAGHSVAIRATGTATRDGHVWFVADSGGVHANGNVFASNANGSGGTVETRGTTLDVGGATVLAGTWKLGAPTFIVTQVTAYRLVNNVNDLQNVALDVAGNYALGKDIDASGTTVFNPIGSLPGPVAALSGAPSTGQFDGMGHTIDNLRINGVAYGPIDIGRGGPSAALGLFGVVGKNGVVHDVNLTNAAIGVGSNVGSFGLLVGVNYGLVTYSSSSGNVTDFIIIGGGPDGGFVGSNYGTVERSSSSAAVLTQGDAGGLVGDNYGTIAQSFVTGSVGRGSHGGTGGIVGTNAGLLTQSYSTGYAQDAGLAEDNTAAGIIDQSFAANLVSGPGEPGSFHGGVAFYNYGAIHNNVYWDRTVTTQTSAFTSSRHG